VAGRPFPEANYNVSGWVFDLPAEAQRRLWTNAVAMLGRVNRLDWRRGFAALDKPQYGPPGLNQYLAWLRAWRAESGGGAPNPTIDAALDYLERAKPEAPHVDVIWGDSNPGNMLIADDHSVAAVLDFEAAALGPGEIDLGWWLFMDERRAYGLTRLPGFPDRSEMIAIYEAAIGRPVDDMHYYEVLGGVRMSLVIVRTTDRLIEMGRLSPTCQAGLRNPIAACLARKLGLDADEGGEDFMRFAKAVAQR
jgi:aminoglycoside phosphotransferase (APT) family kinase protein